jgi:hypothetical protein
VSGVDVRCQALGKFYLARRTIAAGRPASFHRTKSAFAVNEPLQLLKVRHFASERTVPSAPDTRRLVVNRPILSNVCSRRGARTAVFILRSQSSPSLGSQGTPCRGHFRELSGVEFSGTASVSVQSSNSGTSPCRHLVAVKRRSSCRNQ